MARYRNGKYILLLLLACLLVLMPIMSLDAGISGDEEVHLKQAQSVIKYYTSFGNDRTALHTPVTNLKNYGQSFDNLTTLAAQLFGVDDIYTFRHFSNAIIGWLCLLFAALIAVHLSGYKAAVFTVLLLAVSPRFMGHSLNNLKDIPFALGYIASIYFMLKTIGNLKNISLKYAVGLILSMAFTLSIRPGGLLVYCYFALFVGVTLFITAKKENIEKKSIVKILKSSALIILSSYFIGLLFWPYALENPILNPFRAMMMMTDYPVTLRQLFEGQVYWSDQLPWYYLLKYITITIPLVVLPLFIAYVVHLFGKLNTPAQLVQKGILLFAILFPLAYAIIADSNVYGAWRHLLFVYPPLVVATSVGLCHVLDLIKPVLLKTVLVTLFVLTLIPSGLFIYRNHPLEYTYFNALAGDFNTVADNYELDYYYHSVREASVWLKEYIQNEEADSVKIASSYGIDEYFADSEKPVVFSYVPYYARGNSDWDYGIFYRTTVSPLQTSQKLWPPIGTIKSIKVQDIPVCAIVKRQTHADYLGKLAYEKENYTQAVSYLGKATQIDPGNEIAWINLGKSYLKLKQYAEAKAAFNQCLLMIPDYEPSMYYLAQIEMLMGDTDKAKRYYSQILRNNNKSFKTYLAYARLEESLNEHTKALHLIDECLKLNPRYELALTMKRELTKKLNNK